MALFLLIITSLVSLFTGCGGGGAAMETFPGSNVSLDGTIDWEGARTDHNGGNTLGSMFTPRELTTDEQCLGGSSNDVAHCVKPTDDGGYIVAGYSFSTDGDASGSGNHGGGDAWIIKYSSSGSIMWQKCYGGSEWDCAFSIDQTADGGYIFAGVTRSSDGDVQSRFSKTETDEDIWVVKLSPSGAIVWEKYIGDYGTERATSVCKAGDGCVVAAYTDYSTFVVKLDAAGTSTWSRYYGEGGDSSITSIIRASDGNYVCAGYTAANGGDTEGNHGGYDAWVMKLDPNGEPLWHRCVGGTSVDRAYSIQQTAEGSYLIAGGTRSNSGDLAGKNPSYNDCCWVFRLDGTGNTIEWQNLINNGAYGCWGRSARVSSDVGYIVAGYVYYTSQNYNGFVAKFDSSGTLSWVRSPGGSGPDYMYSVCEANGSYVAAGENNSYNTPGNHGGTDAFVARINGDVTPSPSPSPSPTNKKLTIENSQADPVEFTPPDQTTTISATIKATDFTPTNLKWDVVVKDMYDNDIRTFPTGSGLNVSVLWDGMKDNGNFAGYGEYEFEIKAQCDNSGVAPVTVTGSINSSPLPPILTELSPTSSIDLIDDEGKKIQPIYYLKKGDTIIQNPVNVPLSIATSSLGLNSKKAPPLKSIKWKCQFNYEGDLLGSVYYEIRLRSRRGDILLPSYYIEFDQRNKSAKMDVTLNFYSVQKIDGIWYDSKLLPNGKWKETFIAQKAIYVSLNEANSKALPPFNKGQGIPDKMMDIACLLAEGSNNVDNARNIMLPRLQSWLKENNFCYNPAAVKFRIKGDLEISPQGGIFNYEQFMEPLSGGQNLKFWGDCEDVSALYALYCAAMGVEINLRRLTPSSADENFTTYNVKPCGAQEYYRGQEVEPAFLERQFSLHQVADLSHKVWDPTLFFQSKPLMMGEWDYDYRNYLVKPPLPPNGYNFWIAFKLIDY